MSCYNKCSHEQEILNRLATIEAKEMHDVQTVNGVYGPFITLDFPNVTSFTELVEEVNNMSFVKEVMSYTATPTTFKARVKMRDDTVIEMVLPPVSETNMGVMTPSAYAQIWTNKEQIEQMLLGTSIPTGDLETATPTQLQLTTLWTTTMERDPADGDRVMNTFNNVIWLFASGLWHAISESSTPMATNLTLGTVMGSTADGKTQVELDGTLSVNGWDATREDILSKIPKTDIVTSIGATPSDIKVPSEKASKDYVDNEITGKLDKVTAPQTVKKVYTVGTDGMNGLDDYEYVGYSYPIPIINSYSNSSANNEYVFNEIASIPINGVISHGNLTSTYEPPSISGSIIGYSDNSISFPYSEKNSSGSCLVTYYSTMIGGYGVPYRYYQTVVGNLSSGVITFNAKLCHTVENNLGKIYILSIGF